MKEEQVDELDEKGNKTGRLSPLGQLHHKQLWHGVTHVWIYNEKGQILLQKRHPDVKWGANKWDLAAGGHIRAGETPSLAAIREAKEEISLELSEPDLKLAGTTTAIGKAPKTGRDHKAYEWNFITEQDLDPKTLELQTDETADLKWFDLDIVEADLKDPKKSQKYAPRSSKIYELVISKIKGELTK